LGISDPLGADEMIAKVKELLKPVNHAMPYAQLMVALMIAAITTLPPTIMAYAAYQQGQTNEDRVEETKVLAKDIVEKTDQIHVLTNSNLTALKVDLENANRQIADLQLMVIRLVEEKKESLKPEDRNSVFPPKK
jgi:hypothetical protein